MNTFGSLFAGIGGIDLGLERAGWQCKWQVEIDPYAQYVLDKHWPDIPTLPDVKDFPPDEGQWDVDLIAAGFPCQDISVAGGSHQKGLDGDRSGLYAEVIRICNLLRPRWLVLENVSALLTRGLGRIYTDLAQIGLPEGPPHFTYMEHHCIPANSVGAPHQRDRIFIIANANGERLQRHGELGHPRQICTQETLGLCRSEAGQGQWGTESNVDRMGHGFPNRVDRIKALGNSVVPQVAEYLGRSIMEYDHAD